MIKRRDKINDKMFKRIFCNPQNVRTFLKIALPESLRKRITLSELDIFSNHYVSNDYVASLSELVIKTFLITGQNEKRRLDINLIQVYKSGEEFKKKILIQLREYVSKAWRRDVERDRPPRLIIPLIFYHGEKKWSLPQSFIEMTDTKDEGNEFLLDFRYVLFDTGNWDFRTEGNDELKQNAFFLTAMVLMKCAFNDDTDSIFEIFKYLHDNGLDKRSQVFFFLNYITEAKDITHEKLQEILKETKIKGGDIMPTLAQRLIDEGRIQERKEEALIGFFEGVTEGERMTKKKIAGKLLKMGMDKKKIIRVLEIDNKKLKEFTA